MILQELLKHELYKIFSRKIIYVTITIFVLLFLLISLQQKSELYGNYKSFYSEYKKYKGPLTSDKVKLAQNWFENDQKNYIVTEKDGRTHLTQEGMRKNEIFIDVVNAQRRIINHTDQLNELKHQLTTMEHKGYKYEETSLKYSMLKRLPAPGVYIWGFFGTSDLIDFIYSFGFVFMGAMVLLGISPIFSDEYSNNMDSLILTTKNGKGLVITAKIIASITYVTVIGLFFSLLNLLTLGINKGLLTYAIDELNNPLNSIYKYATTPYNFTIIQYYILQTIIFITGGIAFGLLVMFISSISSSGLISFFAGGIIFSYPVFLNVFIGNIKGFLAIIKDFSYTELIRVENLFKAFETYNILGHPILIANLMLILFTVLSLVIIVLIYRTFRNHQVY